jgi:hypothetical protein
VVVKRSGFKLHIACHNLRFRNFFYHARYILAIAGSMNGAATFNKIAATYNFDIKNGANNDPVPKNNLMIFKISSNL